VGTLHELVLSAAERRREEPALHFHGRKIPYEDLAERVRRTAAALHGLGVRREDRVAMLVGNVPEFLYALYGSMAIGAAAAPLNTMLTPEEVGYVLADAEAKVVVAETDFLPTVLAVRDRVASIENIVVVGPPPVPRRTRSLEEMITQGGDFPQIEVGEGDLALLAYTSGATAEPRGAMLSHGNLLANLDQLAAVPTLAQAASDVILLALPLFHLYGLNAVLNFMLRVGATGVLVERFHPVETLELVERYRVTVLCGVPPMFKAWLRAAESRDFDLSSVRLAVSGAAALPPDVLEAFRERFGLTIWEGYGLTETGPALTTNALAPEPRPGSIGLPLPGVEVRLVGEHGEQPVEGDPGEIVARGSNVFRGYWRRVGETEEAFLEDGWFRTGDVAYEDDDGFFHLVDRKKDLVIVSGFNVFPREVEDVVAAHPAVAECAVVGVPDERTGEAVRVLVVLRRGAKVTQEQIVDHCRATLARFKCPREVLFVDRLPKHVTGKVMRRDLRGEPGGVARPERGSGGSSERAHPPAPDGGSGGVARQERGSGGSSERAHPPAPDRKEES
jgi:long-chain acyl-CoA synthetase